MCFKSRKVGMLNPMRDRNEGMHRGGGTEGICDHGTPTDSQYASANSNIFGTYISNSTRVDEGR